MTVEELAACLIQDSRLECREMLQSPYARGYRALCTHSFQRALKTAALQGYPVARPEERNQALFDYLEQIALRGEREGYHACGTTKAAMIDLTHIFHHAFHLSPDERGTYYERALETLQKTYPLVTTTTCSIPQGQAPDGRTSS
jgi:hypothetical protein